MKGDFHVRFRERFGLKCPGLLDNVLSMYSGFCWYHMKFVDCKEVEGHFIDQKVELTDFLNMSLRSLVKHKILDMKKYQYKYHLFAFVCDKELPSPEDIIK